MARTRERKQLDVWEVRTEDGGVGVEVSGAVYMGWDAEDAERVLRLVLSGVAVLEDVDQGEGSLTNGCS